MSLFKRYHPPGTAPGTLVEHPEADRFPLRLELFDYDKKTFERREIHQITDTVEFLARSTVTWLHAQGHPDPASLHALAEVFGLHPLALEDVLNSGQRPKVEQYDGQLFLALSLPEFNDDQVVIHQISLFVGKNYLLSFGADSAAPFAGVLRRLHDANSLLRKSGSDYLLYALLDTVIDQGFPLLERFGEQIEHVEDELLDQPEKATLSDIHTLRRELLLLRRMLWPHREIVNSLLRDEHALILPETRLFLRDCYDHSLQIMDLLETYRDMSAAMLDVYLSSVSNRLGEIMRLLTVISTIFIPLTFLVGVYGMNFGRTDPRSPWAMPELDWYFGYPLLWLIMLLLALAMIGYFKYRRWF